MSDLHDCTTCCTHMHVKYDLTLVCEFYIFFFIDNFLKEFSKKGPIYMYNMLYSYAYKYAFTLI